MIRLTLLLTVAIGVTMLVAGRDLSPEERAALGRPAVTRAVAAVDSPAGAAVAGDLAAAPEPPATLVSGHAVDQAVQLALADDRLTGEAGGAAEASTLAVGHDPLWPAPARRLMIPAPAEGQASGGVRLAGSDAGASAPPPSGGLFADSANVGAAAPTDWLSQPAADPAEPGDPADLADEVAAALSDSQVRYVTGDVVNVREGPSTDYAVVGKVSYGEATEILSDPADPWVRIRIQGDGVEGYIAGRFLSDSEPNG